MKFNFLESFEEKIYFKTSHLFWHFLTGIGGLALLIGALIFIWGLTPSIKPGVKKPNYPKPLKVSAHEIKQKILPAPQKITGENVALVSEKPISSDEKKITEDVQFEDYTKIAYLASIDTLKNFLPANKFPWKSRGHWDQRYYRKKWVVDVWGIEDRLNSTYREINAEDYISKKQVLDEYISIVSLFPENQRYSVLKSAIDFSKNDVQTSITNVNFLKSSVANYSTDDDDFITTLATFGQKNPRDGCRFIEYSNSIITNFDPEIRKPVLSALVSSYYKHFNLIGKQEEATNLFLEIRDEFDASDQVKALSEYYALFTDKNYSREQQIEQMNNEYEYNRSNSNSILSRKKANKAKYRKLGIQAVGASVVFIAFVALFLVLLSIQRNIKMMRERQVLDV